MAQDQTDRLPGVTFSVVESNYHGAAAGIVGNVRMTAKIDDVDLWKEVVRKLNGYRIYTVNDLSATMIEVTQKKLAKAEEELEGQRRRFHAQLENLRQKNSFLEAENQQLKDHLAALQVRGGVE